MTVAEAQEIALAPLEPLAACSKEHFNQCFAVMDAALPKRSSGDVSGKLMLAAYHRKLGSYSKDQINYLCDRILDDCRWFPTIAECVELIGGFTRSDDAFRRKETAKAIVWKDKQRQMDEAMAAMKAGDFTQAQVNALPKHWLQVAEERGYLSRIDGGFVLREAKNGSVLQ